MCPWKWDHDWSFKTACHVRSFTTEAKLSLQIFLFAFIMIRKSTVFVMNILFVVFSERRVIVVVAWEYLVIYLQALFECLSDCGKQINFRKKYQVWPLKYIYIIKKDCMAFPLPLKSGLKAFNLENRQLYKVLWVTWPGIQLHLEPRHWPSQRLERESNTPTSRFVVGRRASSILLKWFYTLYRWICYVVYMYMPEYRDITFALFLSISTYLYI